MTEETAINSFSNISNQFMNAVDRVVIRSAVLAGHIVSLDYSGERYADNPDGHLRAREKMSTAAVAFFALFATMGVVAFFSGGGLVGYCLGGTAAIGVALSIKEVALQDKAREQEKEDWRIEDTPENTYGVLDFALEVGANLNNIYEAIIEGKEPKENYTALAKRLKSRFTPEATQRLNIIIATTIAVGMISIFALAIGSNALAIGSNAAALPVLMSGVIGINLIAMLAVAILKKQHPKEQEDLLHSLQLEPHKSEELD